MSSNFHVAPSPFFEIPFRDSNKIGFDPGRDPRLEIHTPLAKGDQPDGNP